MNPKPFNSNYLEDQDGHQVWYAQYGNPNGPAVVSLHGGPGSKSKLKHIQGFELDKYHVIAFDQRGCGKSEPTGEIAHNTITDLLADIERLRTELQIEKWFVAGGSWGSTLALAYSETYPERVLGLLLRSIFLARETDIAWSFTSKIGIAKLFPDLWEQHQKFFETYKTSPQSAAQVLLENIKSGSDEQIKQIVAGVNNWEGNLMTAQTDLNFMEPEDVDDETIASVKIFLHYQANNFFLKPNQILENIKQITHIPSVIVHGRYDALCPAEQMWQLHKALDNVETIILPTSNHRLTAEGEIAQNLAYNYFLHKQSI